MTTPLLLRILAVVAFLQFAGHGIMFVRARPTHGPDEAAVVDAMRSHTFRFSSAPRSYWQMYFGYGLEAAFVCLVEAVLFWQLAAIGVRDATLVRPIAVLFAVANSGHFVLLAYYFAFPIPMAFDAIIVGGLLAAAAMA